MQKPNSGLLSCLGSKDQAKLRVPMPLSPSCCQRWRWGLPWRLPRPRATILARQPEIARALITHRMPLDAAPEAFEIAARRSSGAIKVVLEP